MQKFLKLQNDSKKPWKRKPVCAPVQAHEVYSQGISKSRAKASFVICTWALNLSGPTKGKLLNAALPIVVCGWETGSQRRWRRDASEMQRSSRTWDGWREGGGREGGKKLDGCMDTKTLWGGGRSRGRSWNNINAKEESEKKSRLVFLLPFPTASRKAKPGLLPPPAPQPRGLQPENSLRASGAQGWEPRFARQSISPAHAGRALMFLFQDKFSINICRL